MIFSKNIAAALIISLFGTAAFAQTKQRVLIRGKHNRAIYVEEELPNLVSETKFDGKYFKIVKGKSNEAISLNESDAALRLKAATTYYHLNRARDFWVNEIHSNNVIHLQKVVIRLELTNRFSDLGHFYNDSLEPQSNDALSVPSGETMDDAVDADGNPVEKEYWGPEIWFRPKKKIRSEDLPGSGLGADGNPLTPYISMLSEPIKSSTTSRFIQTTLQKIFYPTTLTTTYQSSVLRQAGTLAMIAVVMEASKHTDKLFLEKYYYLDTAMVPEIIYHEFAHIAMSDQLTLGLSTPMLEGMADYFATTMTNNATIGKKISKYSLSMPKNGKNKNTYRPIYETNLFANSDFVLSVLWSVRSEFPEVADRLIFEAHTHLATETSNIHNDLISALLESCSKICLNPRLDRLKMHEVFEMRGF